MTFPLYVIPVLGKSRGLIAIFIFYLILMPIVYSGIGQWDHGEWNSTSVMRFCIISSACIFSAYFFESSSVNAYNVIQDTLKKEQVYLKQLEKLSTTDQLTGLNNRRYFDKQFKLEIQKVQRFSTELSLMMLDLDHFKTINDQFGHPIGDQVLKEFSQLLQSKIRATDILSRWGGEEFIILMPQTSLSNAAIFAEKIRSMIKRHTFETISQLTISIGITSVELDSNGENNAMSKVDKALYQAKRAGRDRVFVSD
ncbi:MAG: GGDEF domain-containing protein [Enterobacterales bacterium]|nr:GGDEF domain-containing protein [Enterobacterales bacterium]